MTDRPVGVVMPAWNEERRLPDALGSLLAQRGVVLDVVVIANGCVDRSAAVARGWIADFERAGHRLRVIELAASSKMAAMNAGDAALRNFPRAYVDADVTLDPEALHAVAAALDGPGPLLAAPRIAFTVEPGGGTARIARLLERMPPFVDDVVGGGCYAVNAAGRGQWGAFPILLSDDSFVCSRFTRNQRVLVTEAWFATRFPSRSRLVATFARWIVGRRQLTAMGVPLVRTSRWRIVRHLAFAPGLWLDLLDLAWVKAAARRSARRQLAAGQTEWVRAE